MKDIFSLQGKLALVTGCKRGIGYAMAEALAEAGADIIGVSASLEPEGSDIEKSVQKAGQHFYSYQCDFSNRKSLYTFIAKVKEDHPVIDILVNNAGLQKDSPFTEMSLDDWNKVIGINLY